MDSRYFSLLDMAIVAVPVFVIAIWQLVSVNREIARDITAKTDAASPEGTGHPVGEHRLDDR